MNFVVHNNTFPEYDAVLNPSCQQIGGGITATSSTFDKNTSLFPELLLECTNINFCVITWQCNIRFSFGGCDLSPNMCHDVNSASTEVFGRLLTIQIFGMILMLMALLWY